MKVSKARAAENREALLRAAAMQIRERGYGEMSMADVAAAAGLTHGALYSHFSSKEALQAEATRAASQETADQFEGLAFDALVKRYLAARHRDHPGRGCPNAALVSDIPRQPKATREAFRDGLQRIVSIVEGKLPDGAEGGRHERAVTAFAAMVGGLALSRALRGVDRSAADDILSAVGAGVLGLAEGASSPASADLPIAETRAIAKGARKEGTN